MNLVREFSITDMFADPELERSLLSAMCTDSEVYYQVIDYVPPDVWYHHREAFEDLALMIEQGEPVAPMDNNPTADPVGVARELAEIHRKRLLAHLLEQATDILHTSESSTSILSKLESGVSNVQQSILEMRAGETIPAISLFDQILKEVKEKYEARQQGQTCVGLPSGIRKLDDYLGGYQEGIHILAAEPGQGKTTFVLQVSRSIAEKVPVLFVSFEESVERLALKLVCQAAKAPFKRFTDGLGKPEELVALCRRYEQDLKLIHFVEGGSRTTVNQVKAKAMKLMREHKTDRCMIIIDYLQRWANIVDPDLLVESDGDRRTNKDFRFVVGRLSAQLREMSLRLKSPALVISSQNRGGQGGNSLTSLKESGDLEYGADSVAFLTKSENQVQQGCRAVELKLAKNRYGDQGTINLIFKPEIGNFAEEEGVII